MELRELEAFGEPALKLILQRMPATLELAFAAFILAIVFGIPLGMYAGLKPESPASRAIMAGSILGFSLPTFWVGLMLIMVFAVILGWLPSTGRGWRVSIEPSRACQIPTYPSKPGGSSNQPCAIAEEMRGVLTTGADLDDVAGAGGGRELRHLGADRAVRRRAARIYVQDRIKPALAEVALFSEEFLLVRPSEDAGKPVPSREALREMRLLLLEEGHFPAIATHDEAMIDFAQERVAAAGIPRERVSFQLLHGVMPRLQARLSDNQLLAIASVVFAGGLAVVADDMSGAYRSFAQTPRTPGRRRSGTRRAWSAGCRCRRAPGPRAAPARTTCRAVRGFSLPVIVPAARQACVARSSVPRRLG
mgnify:CR=1 FL=1